MNNAPKYLKANMQAAAELYREGQISRAECFRHEVDVSCGRDSGPINIIGQESAALEVLEP